MYNINKHSKYDKEGIAALLPVYTDGIGDTTEVIGNEKKNNRSKSTCYKASS